MASREATNTDPAQLALDFSSALDDRRRQLRAALKRLCWPRLVEWSLCLWVLHVERDGRGLVRNYDELADALWCSPRAVLDAVNALAQAEILERIPTYDRDGGRKANEYRLAWPRIAALVRLAVADLGAISAPPPANFSPPPAESANPIRNTVPSGIPSPHPCSGTGGTESAEMEISYRQPAAAPAELTARLPVLAEASGRMLSPLPAGQYAFSVFKPLAAETIRSSDGIIDWHRRQLSAPFPVLAGSEAELLLSLAAAIWVYTRKERDVRANRVALFIHVVSQRKWLDVLECLGFAAERLAALAAERGRYWLAAETAAVAATESTADDAENAEGESP